MVHLELTWKLLLCFCPHLFIINTSLVLSLWDRWMDPEQYIWVQSTVQDQDKSLILCVPILSSVKLK